MEQDLARIFFVLFRIHAMFPDSTHHSAFSSPAGNAGVLTFRHTILRMRIFRKRLLDNFQFRITTWACVLVVLAFRCVLGGSLRAQDVAVEGALVAEIRIVDESGKAGAQWTPPLALQAGKPFDLAVERESLRTLYLTGDYSEIRVAATPGAAGLRVDFIVVRNFYNNSVRVDGLKPPPTVPAAVAAMRLALGEPFRESAFHEGIDRLKETLQQDGFYEAKVTWTLTPHEVTRQMDISVD